MQNLACRLFVFATLIALLIGSAAVPTLLAHDEEDGDGSGGGSGNVGNGAFMAATACAGGMAGPYPCANVDLLAFIPTNLLGGGATNDVWGWTDPQTGHEIVLLGRSTGTSFVDVTDPEHPVYLGNLPAHGGVASPWRAIRVYANHAFIVSEAGGHGMQVFDLTQLRNVVVPAQTFTETAHYGGLGQAHTITINEATGYAYINGNRATCAGGLHMVDIRDPLNPVRVGCFGGDGYTHDAECVLYNGPDTQHHGKEICFAANEDSLTVVDVTNKGAPALISRSTYPGSGYSHQGSLSAGQAYFLLGDELDERNLNTNTRTHIFDVRDLDAPQRFQIWEHPTQAIDHQLFVHNGLVYQSNYQAGLRILSVGAVAQGVLHEVAFFDSIPNSDARDFEGTWANYPFFASGAIAFNGISEGLFLVRRNLAGTGMGQPNYYVRTAAAQQTVTAGATATYQLTVNPQNGFSGTVNLACTGAPAAATCSVAPAQITAGNAPVIVTVSVATTAPVRAGLAPNSLPVYLAILPVGLVLTGASRRKRWLAIAALTFLVVLMVNCGGGGSSSGGAQNQPGTPPGTYSLAVTATSGNLQRVTNLNLVVQ